jgi:Ni/Fe-hydrogenase 1 B-type cytochrome subunit
VKLLLNPLPIRIFHWVMVTSVSILLFTGLYIHQPPAWLHLPLSGMRKLHGIFAVLLITNLIGQIYYYVYTKKFTEVLFLPRDFTNFRAFLRYYFFVTEHHPNFGRYNPGQKLLFTAWGLAILAAALTGTALFFIDSSSWLQKVFGGLNSLRIVQYLVAMFFAATIPFHIYLVFTEEPAKLQAMFTGYLQKEPLPVPGKIQPKSK